MLCLVREPYAEKIPGLATLLQYLAESGFDVCLLAPRDAAYPAPTFLGSHLSYREVRSSPRARLGPARVPATLRLGLDAWRLAGDASVRVVVGATLLGAIAARVVARVRRKIFVAFCVELPARRRELRELRWHYRLEGPTLRAADLVITQDDDHAGFISEELGVERRRILTLPNAARGAGGRRESRVLAGRLGLPEGVVKILHSGGFGPWFSCRELAAAAAGWPEDWRLIFHMNHDPGGDPYFREVRASAAAGRVGFSLEPADAGNLDALVSSADIGVALYDVALLGHRAELMGLASGKIGAYLKCGLPVVASDLPTVRRYVEGYRCGVCVRDAAEVRGAVETILADYEAYARNARQCFEELWNPERQCAEIAARLRALAVPAGGAGA